MVSMDKWGEIPLTFCAMTFLKTSLLCHNYRQKKCLDPKKCLTVYSSHKDEVLFFLINVLEKKIDLIFQNTIKNHENILSELNSNHIFTTKFSVHIYTKHKPIGILPSSSQSQRLLTRVEQNVRHLNTNNQFVEILEITLERNWKLLGAIYRPRASVLVLVCKLFTTGKFRFPGFKLSPF